MRRNPKESQQRQAAWANADRLVQAGALGMCLVGVPLDAQGQGADFVHYQYLCNRWTGREGASVATEGHPIDKLPEELKDDD